MKARSEAEWIIMLARPPGGKPKIDDFDIIYLKL